MAIDYTRRGKPAPETDWLPGTTGGSGSARPPVDPEPPVDAGPPGGARIDFSRPSRTAPPQNSSTPPAGSASTAAPPASTSAPVAASAGAARVPTVSLNKITLTKSSPTISLTKSGQSQGVMRVNLNWTTKPAGKGFFAKIAGTDSIDLDLGCLYELSDGRKGGIQALGKSFGSLNSSPYIQLDGDDRTGATAGGENLLINLAEPSRFRRILIFAMIYQGATKWGEADGVVTLYPTAGPEVEVRLDASDTDSRVCSIALLENRGGELVVQREVRYVQGSQQKLDEMYGWGLSWAPGRK